MTRTLCRILALLALALPALAASETREVGAFNAFVLAAPIDVDLVLGDRESVTLEGDPKLLARIEAVVENGALKLRMRRETGWKTYNWNETARARVTARRLDAMSITGSGDIHARELRGGAMAISISGSGDVHVAGGSVANLTLAISGSGDIRTPRLEAQHVEVSISGSGDATVWARETLSVKVAGSGEVKFYGDPALQSRIAGSGEVKRLGPSPG